MASQVQNFIGSLFHGFPKVQYTFKSCPGTLAALIAKERTDPRGLSDEMGRVQGGMAVDTRRLLHFHV